MINLTEEQKEVVNSKDNLVIEARAGSGKTFTLIQYALANQEKSKIYLCFNSSIQQEAESKFEKAGIRNIKAKTLHSLAHDKYIKTRIYNLSTYNPSVYGLCKHFGLKKKIDNIIINHSLKLFNLFCQSPWDKIEDIIYYDTLETEKSQNFFVEYKNQINNYADKIWKDMENKKLDACFSFLLKMYQLSKPILPYNVILFDEGQDADPVMLDILFNQEKATKIIVGDSHQSIYQWRGAINALSMVEYKRKELNTSFRFPQSIANIAVEVLSFKQNFDKEMKPIKIFGKGEESNGNDIRTRAILSRSNLTILDYLFTHKEIQKPYVEKGLDSLLNSQTSGLNILDLFYLKKGQKNNIKNYFLKTFDTIEEVKEYYESIDDISINGALKFIEKYSDLTERILDLKNKEITNSDNADFVFSTIHKSKGKEWDWVKLLDQDFDDCFPYNLPVAKKKNGKEEILTEEEKERIRKKYLEELNLWYVAVTRARKILVHNIEWIPQQCSDVEFDENEDNIEMNSERFSNNFIKELSNLREKETEIGIKNLSIKKQNNNIILQTNGEVKLTMQDLYNLIEKLKDGEN